MVGAGLALAAALRQDEVQQQASWPAADNPAVPKAAAIRLFLVLLAAHLLLFNALGEGAQAGSYGE